jgi:hypothetical protein
LQRDVHAVASSAPASDTHVAIGQLCGDVGSVLPDVPVPDGVLLVVASHGTSPVPSRGRVASINHSPFFGAIT